MDQTPSPQQQQQVSAILAEDPGALEYLVARLMLPSNEDRSSAESLFNVLRDLHPDHLSLSLACLLLSFPIPDLRSMSSILLRRLLPQLWPRLPPSPSDTRPRLLSLLFSTFHREQSRSVSKKLCDAASELASRLLPENAWPDLLPFLFHTLSSSSSTETSNASPPRLQESSLLVLSHLAQHYPDSLLPHLPHLHSLLLDRLSSPSSTPEVRIAALAASINFVQCVSAPSDRDRFQDLLPVTMRTLTEALNSGQEATAQEALELLIDLAGTEPRFLRRQLAEVVGSILQIAEAERLDEGTRHLAVEFVITLAEVRERAPGMMRRLPQFIGRLFAVLMKMLQDIEDDQAWHAAEVEHEDAGETRKYGFGQECLDRLSIALGGNTIVLIASELLLLYSAAPEWQKRHAALITLAQIAEGCSKDGRQPFELYYHGQFDDARPSSNIRVTGKDLSSAIETLLSGQPLSITPKPSIGCSMKWHPQSSQ